MEIKKEEKGRADPWNAYEDDHVVASRRSMQYTR